MRDVQPVRDPQPHLFNNLNQERSVTLVVAGNSSLVTSYSLEN
jgi:hypothetical protein